MRHAALVVAGLLVTPLLGDEKKKTDEESIIGTWKIDKIETGNGPEPQDGFYEKVRITFEKDGKLSGVGFDGEKHAPGGSYKLDSKSKVKKMDLTNTDKTTMHYIYELKGDTLEYAYSNLLNGPRPTGFGDKDIVIFTLKRVTNKKR